MTEYQLMRLCAEEHHNRDRGSQSIRLQDMDPTTLARPATVISDLRFVLHPDDFRALVKSLTVHSPARAGFAGDLRFYTPYGDPILSADREVPLGKVRVVEERAFPEDKA